MESGVRALLGGGILLLLLRRSEALSVPSLLQLDDDEAVSSLPLNLSESFQVHSHRFVFVCALIC